MAMTQYSYFLDESQIPTQWYNIPADMPSPPIHPATHEHFGPEANTDILKVS